MERQSRCLPLQRIQKQKEPYMNRIVIVTDSKSIFDVLARKSVGGIIRVDKRAGLELQIVLATLLRRIVLLGATSQESG
eukprot:1685654-Amphidinium_carterae.1